MSFTPISGYTNSITTQNGTSYFYSGANAGKVVAMASVALEAAMVEDKQKQATDAMNKLSAEHSLNDIVITASALTVAGTIAGIVGAGAAVAGTAASVTGVATGIAALALSSSSNDTEALDITVSNNTFAPVVCYEFATTNCSNASFCPPLLPGGSGAMTIISEDGDGFQKNNDSIIGLSFLVGAGFYMPEGAEQQEALTDIDARIEFYYNSESVWYPKFYVDGAASPMDTDDVDGLSAVCFIPNETSNALGFTLASGLVEKASCALDVIFLPVAGSTDD